MINETEIYFSVKTKMCLQDNSLNINNRKEPICNNQFVIQLVFMYFGKTHYNTLTFIS